MIRVLLIEDNPGDVRLIQEMFKDAGKASLHLDQAESLTQGMEVCQREDIDLVLLDLGLPEAQGLDTLSSFLARAPEIPVVVLTVLAQEETGIQAVRNGAQDYLIKGEVDGPLLFRSINYAIERSRAERQINYLNSLLRSVRAVNQVIAQESDLNIILQKSCESLVDTRGYVDVSIAVRDEESGVLSPAAHAGNHPRKTWGVTTEGEGEAPKCINEVLKTKKPFTAEYCGDCNYCPHTTEHQTVVAPCLHEGEILGVLTVCVERDFVLSDEETSLLKEIAGDLALAQAHKRAERNLQERTKDLNCLYSVARDTQEDLSIDEVCRRAVEHLVQGMQFPEITAVVIELNGKRFTSGNYTEELSHGLRAEIRVKEKAHGRLWVYYTEERPFLIPEEQNLVDGIAETLSIWLERKRDEEALKESEEKYRDLFQSSTDGIAKSDLEGKIVDCNKAYLEMTGHSEEEIKSLTYRDLTPERWANVDRKHIDQCLNRGYSDPYEKERIRKDGTVFPISIRTWLRSDSEGNPLGFWGIIRDITERKQAEAEQEKLNAELKQSQKMESVGRLAGGVAHDFNNKLTVIMGKAQLAMQDMDKTDPLYSDLQEIVNAGNQSTNIVRQLLAFARKQTISLKVLRLNDTVEGMLKMLRRLIGEDLDLTWEPGRDLWSVNMDPAQVDQILANLCINAKDAIETGGKVTIETHNVILDAAYCRDHAGFVPGEYLLLAVSDNGKGMDNDTLDNVFEPFFTTKEVGKGTGLGLSTVHGIVKQNNGFINVYSEQGVGTTFKIYLPRHTGDVQEDGEAVQSELPSGRGEAIMIVEDESAVLKVAQRILERFGYQVMTFENPVEAVKWAEDYQGDIDLLVTDVIMPEMSGKALAEAIQKIQPNTRALFMSGYTANAIAHQGVLDKEVHFIQKPFNAESLARKVREVLDI